MRVDYGAGRGVAVDELDLRIIGALQVDGRRPVVDIARELGVPKSTVQRRLDSLIREHVIMIAAYPDGSRLGLAMHVHLNLTVDLDHFQSAVDAVVALTEVRWVAVTTGPYDIVAEAYFASSIHLYEFIRTRLAPIKGITRIESSVILSVEKLSFHWEALRRQADKYNLPHIRLGTPTAAYARPNDNNDHSSDGLADIARSEQQASSPREGE
jgi:Lrp/AsnC family transcriptional regulator for asnA, asnC and gidA